MMTCLCPTVVFYARTVLSRSSSSPVKNTKLRSMKTAIGKESGIFPIMPLARVGVWLLIRAQNIKQKCDILGTNLCIFHLDPSIVQSFAPFSAQISVLVFLRLEWKYKNPRRERRESLYYQGIKMKSTKICSQNVTLLFNILGSNQEPDPYSQVAVTDLYSRLLAARERLLLPPPERD